MTKGITEIQNFNAKW